MRGRRPKQGKCELDSQAKYSVACNRKTTMQLSKLLSWVKQLKSKTNHHQPDGFE